MSFWEARLRVREPDLPDAEVDRRLGELRASEGRRLRSALLREWSAALGRPVGEDELLEPRRSNGL